MFVGVGVEEGAGGWERYNKHKELKDERVMVPVSRFAGNELVLL